MNRFISYLGFIENDSNIFEFFELMTLDKELIIVIRNKFGDIVGYFKNKNIQ